MRLSTALLHQTPIRISDLEFPRSGVHIPRTRLAFIHLDNLLNFGKIDRDGQVDGYILAYLPHELVILLLKSGEVVSSATFTEAGRMVLPIAVAVERIREETERGHLAYYGASMEQVAWMYASCEGPAIQRPSSELGLGDLLQRFEQERFTGVAELISDGRVTYLRLEDGRLLRGYYADKPENETPGDFVARVCQTRPGHRAPSLALSVFPARGDLPEQAPPAMIDAYRDLLRKLTEIAEREAPGEGHRRGGRVRDALKASHPALQLIASSPDQPAPLVVATAGDLTVALSEWAKQLLEQLEIISPGIAPLVLHDATRDQRFVLQKAGFYARLPWPVAW